MSSERRSKTEPQSKKNPQKPVQPTAKKNNKKDPRKITIAGKWKQDRNKSEKMSPDRGGSGKNGWKVWSSPPLVEAVAFAGRENETERKLAANKEGALVHFCMSLGCASEPSPSWVLLDFAVPRKSSPTKKERQPFVSMHLFSACKTPLDDPAEHSNLSNGCHFLPRAILHFHFSAKGHKKTGEPAQNPVRIFRPQVGTQD